jgi:4-phytase / acid phosphatase
MKLFHLNIALLSFLFLGPHRMPAQSEKRSTGSGDTLKLVVVLSRHGVRSPTQANAQLDQLSIKPWPQWSVAPGELTPRGALLLRQFAVWQRVQLAAQGLLQPQGCSDAAQVYIYADSDQRTVASGHALAEGLMPGCRVRIDSLPQGTEDALFHPLAAKAIAVDRQFAVDALRERVHGDPSLPAREHQPALEEVQRILNSCAAQPSSCSKAPAEKATSVTGIVPAILPGKSDHLADLRGPLAAGSSMSENFLLEYAEGLPLDQVGWGQVQERQLQYLLPLHSAYFDLMHRTPYFAQAEASNLLDHIRRTLEQGATGKSIDGAIGPRGAKVVILTGHDTNLAGVASLLGVHWDLDGRHDDTPPGAEMAFELWQRGDTYFVRLRYSVQTLAQMRAAQPLSEQNQPASEMPEMPCMDGAGQCSLAGFSQLVQQAVRPEFIR